MVEFDAIVSLLLHDLARKLRHAFDAQSRSLGVTRQQWRALLFLSRRIGATQSEVAEALEVEPIAVGRMIDRLVDNGFVERRVDASDRRLRRLHLLPTAENIVDELTRIAAALETEALSGLAPAKRDELILLLRQMQSGVRRVVSRIEAEEQSSRLRKAANG